MVVSNRRLALRIKRLRDDTEGTSVLRKGGGPDKTPAQNVAAWYDTLATGTKHIHFPELGNEPTRYLVDEPLAARDDSGLLVTGGGISPQRQASQVVAVGAGDWSLFDFAGSHGYTMSGVSPSYRDLDFSGLLIDVRGFTREDGTKREGKMFTFEDGWLGGLRKANPDIGETYSGDGIAMTRGHGHRIRNAIIGRCRHSLVGREPGSYSNRVRITDTVLWENVVHVLDAGDSWSFDNITFQQGYGAGSLGTVFRMSESHNPHAPLDSVAWRNVWHGDSDRGVGWELRDCTNFLFQGNFSCYSGPDSDPTEHTTIKVIGRVDGLDCSGASFKGRTERSIAVDLGYQLVSRFQGGAYGQPGAWWHIPDPVRGVPADVM